MCHHRRRARPDFVQLVFYVSPPEPATDRVVVDAAPAKQKRCLKCQLSKVWFQMQYSYHSICKYRTMESSFRELHVIEHVTCVYCLLVDYCCMYEHIFLASRGFIHERIHTTSCIQCIVWRVFLSEVYELKSAGLNLFRVQRVLILFWSSMIQQL